MIILKSDFNDSITAIYDKTAQESFIIINANINDTELIEKIENLLTQKGIVLCK
jgi:hypothetical protein